MLCGGTGRRHAWHACSLWRGVLGSGDGKRCAWHACSLGLGVCGGKCFGMRKYLDVNDKQLVKMGYFY